MRIEELHLKNFRCFKELDIQFPKSNLAVFIGLNGSGKSAILDAILLILRNHLKNDKNFYTPDDIQIGEKTTENEIVLDFSGEFRSWKSNSNYEKKQDISNEDFDILELLKQYDAEPNKHYSKLFCIYYKTDKKENYIVKNQGVFKANFLQFNSWFKNEEDLENELKLDKKDFNLTNAKLDVVRMAIERFFSKVSSTKFCNLKAKRAYAKDGKIGTYEEEIEKHSNYLSIQYHDKEVKLSQLSDGQRLLINLVGDISYHLASDIDFTDFDSETNEVFYDYFKWSEAEISNVLDTKGIILIDEIELHLHPQWQREVLPALQKTFPNIQFIVTTHSPQVLSNLKKEEVFILKDNKIVEVTPHIEGRDSNSILYELFGVEERPERFKTQLKQLYNAIDDENLSEAKKILAELTTAFGEQDTEIVRANLHLSFAEE